MRYEREQEQGAKLMRSICDSSLIARLSAEKRQYFRQIDAFALLCHVKSEKKRFERFKWERRACDSHRQSKMFAPNWLLPSRLPMVVGDYFLYVIFLLFRVRNFSVLFSNWFLGLSHSHLAEVVVLKITCWESFFSFSLCIDLSASRLVFCGSIKRTSINTWRWLIKITIIHRLIG